MKDGFSSKTMRIKRQEIIIVIIIVSIIVTTELLRKGEVSQHGGRNRQFNEVFKYIQTY